MITPIFFLNFFFFKFYKFLHIPISSILVEVCFVFSLRFKEMKLHNITESDLISNFDLRKRF